MSVIVKGMKMPGNCMECDIRAYDANAEEEYCPFSQLECLNIGRQKDCPLAEIPKNHGRLIDGDALWMDVIHRMEYCDDILEQIEMEPTVIEAEDGT